MSTLTARTRGLTAGVGVLLLAALTPPSASASSETTAAGAPAQLAVVSLSNRADLLSAGDALLEVKLPAGVQPGSVRASR